MHRHSDCEEKHAVHGTVFVFTNDPDALFGENDNIEPWMSHGENRKCMFSARDLCDLRYFPEEWFL